MKSTLCRILLSVLVTTTATHLASTNAQASLTSCLKAVAHLSFTPGDAQVEVFTDEARFVLSSNILGRSPLEYYLYSDHGTCTYRLTENETINRYNTLPILGVQDPWDNSPLYLGMHYIAQDGSGYGLIAQRQRPSVCSTFSSAGRPCPYPGQHTVSCNNNDQRNARARATAYIVDMLTNVPEMLFINTTRAVLREFDLREMPNQPEAIAALLSRSRTYATAVHFAKRTLRSSCGDLTEQLIAQNLADTTARLDSEHTQIRLSTP